MAAIHHRWGPARYATVAAAVILLGAVAQVAFAWWADPYALRGTPGPKIIALLGEQRRLFKAHDLPLHRPDLLLCGTSRVEQALEPGHPAIAALGLTAYNAAMPGSSIYEQLRLVQHAHALHPLRAVWLEVVFMVTSAGTRRVNPGFSEMRLAVDVHGRTQPLHALADLPTWLSLDTQWAAWRTIRAGASPRRPIASIFDRGHFLPANLKLAESNRISFVSGARAAYEDCYRTFAATDREGRNVHLEDLDTLLRFCHDHAIVATIYISPEHAFQSWLIERSGLWPAYAAFKRRVVELGGDAVWDFSSANEITCEPIPPLSQHGRVMADYNDGGHYTVAVGRRVIATLAQGRAVDGFGVRLAAATLDAELQRQRSALLDWATRHPQDAAEVDALVSGSAIPPAPPSTAP